jgi:hypothetical protein
LAFHSGREADHSPPPIAEVEEWVDMYLHSPNAPSWRDAQLGGAQGQLYLYLLHKSSDCDECKARSFNRTIERAVTISKLMTGYYKLRGISGTVLRDNFRLNG